MDKKTKLITQLQKNLEQLRNKPPKVRVVEKIVEKQVPVDISSRVKLDLVAEIVTSLNDSRKELTAGLTSTNNLFREKLEQAIDILAHLPRDVSVNNLGGIINGITSLAKDLASKWDGGIKVINLKDIRPPIISVPREMNLSEPAWLKKYFISIVEKLPVIKLPTDPKEPISVRLSDGNKFYEAITQVMGGFTGGGGSTPKVKSTSNPEIYAVPVVNPDGTNVSGGGGGGGDATAANQVIGNASLASIDGKITAVNTGAVVVSSSALPSGAATSAKQDTVIGHLDGVESLLTTIDGDTGNISTKIDTIAGAVSGTEMQVDIVGPIPAGTNNIGDIDVVSSALPTGASTSAKQDTIIGHLDGVEGLLTTIDADTSTLAGAVAGNEVQVDVLTLPALPAGTNAIGKLAANSGVDIGDVDVTSIIPGTGATNLGKAEDAGHTSADTGIFALGVRNDTPNTATTNTDVDYSQFSTDKVGGVRTALYETDFAVLGTTHVKKYYTNAGAVTDGIIWSPAAGKRWYVTDIFINVSAAATITLEDDLGAGDSAVWKAELAANSGWSHHFGTPLFSGEDAADLIITTSAGNVYVTITGYEI